MLATAHVAVEFFSERKPLREEKKDLEKRFNNFWVLCIFAAGLLLNEFLRTESKAITWAGSISMLAALYWIYGTFNLIIAANRLEVIKDHLLLLSVRWHEAVGSSELFWSLASVDSTNFTIELDEYKVLIAKARVAIAYRVAGYDKGKKYEKDRER